MNEKPPDNGKLSLVDHHARLAVLEALLPRESQALRERMDLKFDAAKDAIKIASEAASAALTLQYGITEKHLLDLNHQHAETKANQAISVTRDKFDDLVKGPIADLIKFRDTSLGRQSVLMVVVSVVVALAIKYLLP